MLFLHYGYKFYWNLPGIHHIYFSLDKNQLWRIVFRRTTMVPRRESGVPAEVSDPREQVKAGIDHDIRAEYRRVNRRVRASSIHRREETRSLA